MRVHRYTLRCTPIYFFAAHMHNDRACFRDQGPGQDPIAPSLVLLGVAVMRKEQATMVKARAVLRSKGHATAEALREYKDWHIEIKSGAAYVSVWSSAGMVFLALSDMPVYYKPGPWEQYLDLLFQRTGL